MRIKKAVIIGMISMMTLLSAIPACAAQKDTSSTDIFEAENKSIKEDLEQVVGRLRLNKKEESADKLQKIIDVLDEMDDDEDALTTVQGTRELIEQIIADEGVCEIMGWDSEFDTNAAIFKSEWLNALGEAVAPYGIRMNTYVFDIYEYDGTYVRETDKSSDAMADKTEKSAEMVQKLRWSRKGDDTASKVNITSVLKEFEIHFSGISTLLQSISAALVVAFGASSLLRMSSDRMIGYDAVLREFFKLIFGVWFIFNYRYFTILILRLGTYVTEVFLDGAENMNTDSQMISIMRHSLWNSLNEMIQNGSVNRSFRGLADAATGVYNITKIEDPWWTQIGTWLCGLCGGVGGFLAGGTIINIAINWVVFAILIELGIRYVFTPIAIADLYSEGYHSNGMRWLKKMLSCALSGALIYLTMYGANVIKTQLTGFHPVQLTAINLTMVGFFVKCRQVADEIVGVR